ncbi:hypothetical protein L0D06_04940 [Salmonella enterica subsp. enterica]|nr:hypothetical protein SEEA1981_08936 [Salmonella enterica subsp. enterica serovar Agona str. 241981]MDG0167764.1 hypothetical protein [Salmonella enterica subsp. enterica]
MDYLIVDRNWPSKQENYYHALRLLTFTPNKICQKTDNGRVILQHKINCHKNGNGDTKRKTMKYNEGTFKYMLKKIIGALASIIGGLLVFYVSIGYFVWIPGQNEGFIQASLYFWLLFS